MQHTCNIANTASTKGHLKNLLFDFRQATMVTVLQEKCLRGTAGILTAVPLWVPPQLTVVRMVMA